MSRFAPKILRYFFYSRLFYGFCAVTLALETERRFGFVGIPIAFYPLLAMAVTLFYLFPHLKKRHKTSVAELDDWYETNNKSLRALVLALSVALVIGVGYLGATKSLVLVTHPRRAALAFFPVLICFFYYNPLPLARRTLRDIAILKPWAIGGVWAAATTLYPWVFATGSRFDDSTRLLWRLFALFGANWTLCAAVAMLCDFQDRDADRLIGLGTPALRLGARDFAFWLIPIAAAGVYLNLAATRAMSPLPAGTPLVAPYIALFATLRSLQRPRSPLHYFLYADGILPLKASIGLAMAYFN